MPRRRKDDRSLSLQAGYYRRRLGYTLGLDGRKKSKVFFLGKAGEEKEAQFRNVLMEKLWEQVVADFEQQRQAKLERFDALAADNHPLLRSPEDPTPITRAEIEQEPPHWTDETLCIAEAVRRGAARVPVPREPGEYAVMYAERVAELGRRFSGYVFVAAEADAPALQAGQAAHAEQATEHREQATQSARAAQVDLPSSPTGQTLYSALEAYAERASRVGSEHASSEAARAKRLQNATPDMDLAELGYSALERIRDYWAARPTAKLANGRSSGRPISIHTVNGQLKTARRFIAWLDETDRFDWELPRHGLRALKVNLARLRTKDEIASRRHGVMTFSVEHLATIWRHASDTDRLLVLLGLNAAMAQAEITGLRWDEVEQGTIKRIRHKSGVYGEFALWPETVQALAWWRKLRGKKGTLVMMTAQGQPYARQRIANIWNRLSLRIEREMSEKPGWWLPFKHLRKTAAQLVRNASDGEVAGVFLSHGQPVASDELSDIYSRRPFDKVAKALEQVHEQLRPMFAAADDAFTSKYIGGRGPHPTASARR